MSFSSVVAQPRVTEALLRALQSERVAHAYLFHGPEGTGKRAAALAFAQALQCERGGTEPGQGGCGLCTPCTKVARLIHPDVHVLLPFPGTDFDDDDEVRARLDRLAADPYEAIDFRRRPSLSDAAKASSKAVLYSVERIHEDLRRPMSYHPVEGRYRIALLTDADALRVEAANAFLKLLEEPAERTVFVLTTERADRLLPTITSRCQHVRFDPLPDEAVAGALAARGVASGPEADGLARMASGSLSRALTLAAQDDLAGRRDLALQLLRFAYAPRSSSAGLIEDVAGLGREPLKGVFEMLLRWIQDLGRYRAQTETARLVNADQAATVAAFVRNVPRADLDAMATLVEEAAGLIDRNVSPALVVRVLADRLGRAMHDGRHMPVFVPLAGAA